jgi:hypothetical protein
MKLINQNKIVQLNIYRRFEKESSAYKLYYKKNEPVIRKRWGFFNETFTPKENLYSYFINLGPIELRTLKELEEFENDIEDDENYFQSHYDVNENGIIYVKPHVVIYTINSNNPKTMYFKNNNELDKWLCQNFTEQNIDYTKWCKIN